LLGLRHQGGAAYLTWRYDRSVGRAAGVAERIANVLRQLARGPERVVPCQDGAGAPARVVVHADPDGVLLSVSTSGPLRLSGRQAQRLAAALAASQAR
jgi:hypothetical protein